MRSTRVIAVVAALLLVAIIACAAALAASSGSATPSIDPAHLVVGAGPPTTATGVLTYTSASGITVTATCAFDFANHTADVVASASVSVVSLSVEAQLHGPVALVNVGPFSSVVGAAWVSIPAPRGPSALHDLAVALRDPAGLHLHPDHTTVRHHDGDTVTTLSFRHVTTPSTAGLPITLPRTGQLTTVVTTGPMGQLLAAVAHLWNHSQSVHLAFVVTGYDVPVSIAAPPHHDVVPLTAARAHAIFGTSAGAFDRVLAGVRRGPG